MSLAKPPRSGRLTLPRRLSQKELEAKKLLVLRNMRELMRDMGHAGKFDNPDEWLKSIVGV
jgi:hypothetical protein